MGGNWAIARHVGARSQHRTPSSTEQRNALTCFAMQNKFTVLFPVRAKHRTLGWWNW
jgi:hypothetical protein